MTPEREKFDLAVEWIETKKPYGMEWNAAYEHLVYVAKNTVDPGILTECRAVIKLALSKTPSRYPH